jgi:group I intron endonuclease
MIGIYKITNTATGKFYLGSSSDIPRRWRQHKHLLRQGKHHSSILQNSWAKHGEQAFVFEVVFECSEADLLDCEQRFLDELRPEYNVTAIAGKVEMTPAVRQKIAKATTNRYKRYDGKTLKQFCSELGADWRQVYRRLARGLPMEEALKPVDAMRTKAGAKKHEYKGVLYTQNELAKLAGVASATIHRRLKAGMTVVMAVEMSPQEVEQRRLEKCAHTRFKAGYDPRRNRKKDE